MSQNKKQTKYTDFNFIANLPYNCQSPGDLRGALWLTNTNNDFINKFLKNIFNINS